MGRRGQRGARSVVTLALILVLSLVFVVKLVQIQVVEAAAYNEVSASKRAVPVTIPSVRGDIVDRNGNVLATTDQRYDVQLSPKNTRAQGGRAWERSAGEDTIATVTVTAEQAYEEIGAITGQTGAEIAKIVDDALAEDPESDFAYVKRSVSLDQMNALKALRVPWLTFDYHFQRTYPNGAVAGNIIGFAGLEAIPQAGVEMSQTACLTGTDGSETYERGADGVALPGSHRVQEQAVPGGTLELTIDRDLQWQAQQTINAQRQRAGAEWALLVVQDVRTGELLAVAEDDSVDPGDVSASDDGKREARSFVDPYEPGSTFKTLTMAALIEEGIATPATQFLTPYTASPEPYVRFSDWFTHADQPWTLAGIFSNSSNVGTALLGTQLSEEKRYEYMTRFGFGQSTNAGLPVEDSGLLYPPSEWDRQTSYNVTFGQGISSTIVQTTGIYQTIGNGGVRIPPSVVRGCAHPDGTFTEYDSGEPVRVVSEETARTTLGLLETVVAENGLGKMTAIPGYRMAGKTGTAEQADGNGGYRDSYVHSFASVFPADDPKVAIVASVGFPGAYELGGEAAALAVKEMAEASIRAMQVPPASGEPVHYPLTY